MVYVVESDGRRVLFGQDVHGPLHADFGSDAAAYRRSLLDMADLGADILCEGHYGVIEGADRVRDFIQSFSETIELDASHAMIDASVC